MREVGWGYCILRGKEVRRIKALRWYFQFEEVLIEKKKQHRTVKKAELPES